MKNKLNTKNISLCEPEIRGNEWKYIKECLDTAWVSSVGGFVDRFEKAVADYVGAKYAVACVNGTAGLHVALVACGIEPGDEVLVPSLSFIAPANAVRYCGGWPVFIDADPQTWQMDPEKVKEFLVKDCRLAGRTLINRRTKRPVRAILPVHVLGHPVDMKPILTLAKKFGLDVIEDATESLGSKYRGRHTGTFGDVGVFSFNGNKIITAGGGGMIVTNNRRLAERIRYLTTQAKDDAIEYIHGAIGFNYRLTNIQAALGVAQMEQLENFVDAKRRLGERYAKALKAIPGVTLPAQAPWALTNFWLYTILIDREIYGKSSRELLADLNRQGIAARPLWHPLHSLKIFKGSYHNGIKIVDELYGRALSLPSSVGLKPDEQDRVIQIILEQPKKRENRRG